MKRKPNIVTSSAVPCRGPSDPLPMLLPPAEQQRPERDPEVLVTERVADGVDRAVDVAEPVSQLPQALRNAVVTERGHQDHDVVGGPCYNESQENGTEGPGRFLLPDQTRGPGFAALLGWGQRSSQSLSRTRDGGTDRSRIHPNEWNVFVIVVRVRVHLWMAVCGIRAGDLVSFPSFLPPHCCDDWTDVLVLVLLRLWSDIFNAARIAMT